MRVYGYGSFLTFSLSPLLDDLGASLPFHYRLGVCITSCYLVVCLCPKFSLVLFLFVLVQQLIYFDVSFYSIFTLIQEMTYYWWQTQKEMYRTPSRCYKWKQGEQLWIQAMNWRIQDQTSMRIKIYGKCSITSALE